jgi:hypothetical protein
VRRFIFAEAGFPPTLAGGSVSAPNYVRAPRAVRDKIAATRPTVSYVMSRSLFLCTALLCAATASAGVRIESVTRDIKTQVADGSAQVLLVQDGKIQMNNAKKGGRVILSNAIFYVIDDTKKTYIEMDKATMKRTAEQAGAAIRQLQEQMKNMPPEQRAQMEKMLGDKMPGMMSGKKDTYEARDTGKSDNAEGRKCQLWNLLKNGAVHEELCVVPFATLPGKEDFQKTFKELAESFEGMARDFPGAGDSFKARLAVNGYPVRVRSFDGEGKLRGTETVLTRWVEESLPAATFEVPAGYQKKELPHMGG